MNQRNRLSNQANLSNKSSQKGSVTLPLSQTLSCHVKDFEPVSLSNKTLCLPTYQKRKIKNQLSLLFAGFALVFGLSFLVLILYKLLVSGFAAMLTMPIFSADTPAGMDIGGLRNAIVGSLMMTGLALGVGVPIGIMAGVYLAEFAQGSWLGKTTRFMNDILLSAPSIIIGLFVFTLMVHGRGFSGWAGACALALIVIPIVVRTTENMLNLVPDTLREATYALGAPKWKLVGYVTLRSAKAGILTGVLLAFARIFGETAPLLFTAMNNQYFSLNMGAPMANLPNAIYQLAQQPYENAQQLAWAGALLVTLAVLGLNMLARLLGKERY
ncbi:phosphate ABC transporter permease [Moraxella macacae 0408225]|uniref:Phosphate transport system permease protein PstA n=1 Tax=Moraxella macacae 0408225 TaxID=1230338 RepID=L2F6V6_9GAMM|nr:phosphate ABC transporter permease PstA [Moraxella macacae]ELA08173.1 phosphate ABC transporter permease [Moraxella macacae 0408225]